MDEYWKLAEVRGWGPDYTNVDAYCPESFCPWEHTWEDSVNLGEIVRTVQAHLAEAHGRGD